MHMKSLNYSRSKWNSAHETILVVTHTAQWKQFVNVKLATLEANQEILGMWELNNIWLFKSVYIKRRKINR